MLLDCPGCSSQLGRTHNLGDGTNNSDLIVREEDGEVAPCDHFDGARMLKLSRAVHYEDVTQSAAR